MNKICITSLLIFVIILSGLYSCKEEFVGQPSVEGNPPQSISNPVVENLPGGATISYDLPDDEDLLYVKAIFYINGVEKNSTASMYEKSLKVEGFGTTDKQTVKLYCVDRNNNYSEPVEVEIQPETPPVRLILESMTMERSFGGVKITWKNEYKADVSIYLVASDSVGDISTADIVYTSSSEGKYNLRGFDDTERLFGVFVRDRWDNYSDTLAGKFTPLYEKKLDKAKWNRELLVGDNTTNLDNYRLFTNLYDDMTSTFWHTLTGKSPILITIDLGVTARISRYTLWHRLEGWAYTHHNPKKWKVYGTANLDQIHEEHDDTEEDYWTDSFQSDPNWTLLADCESYKPSGEGAVTNEDATYADQGFEFEIPLTAPEVRYIRILVEKTWSGGDMLHFSELSFWGELAE